MEKEEGGNEAGNKKRIKGETGTKGESEEDEEQDEEDDAEEDEDDEQSGKTSGISKSSRASKESTKSGGTKLSGSSRSGEGKKTRIDKAKKGRKGHAKTAANAKPKTAANAEVKSKKKAARDRPLSSRKKKNQPTIVTDAKEGEADPLLFDQIKEIAEKEEAKGTPRHNSL